MSLPSVSLVREQQPSKPNLTKCIICKKISGSNRQDILTNAAGSRSNVILASKKLNDGLLDSLDEVEVQKIRFHAKSCYSRYALKASRLKEPAQSTQSDEGGAWSVERGAWSGAWSVERGAWSVERGAWSVERGAWSVERGAWNLECIR